MKISGCMIVRNEENNITRCIESLKGIADEIIVVDTGSEDDTIRIARELGAFVYEQEWQNDFSRAKNYALKQAEGDWIIFLDADEYFREDCRSLVRSAIEAAHPLKTTDGILCDIINVDKNTNRVISDSEILRIFRNHKRIRYFNKIHEELRKDGTPLVCVKARGTLAIMHTGYSDTILKDKAERNLELLLENQEEPKILYYLATSYFLLKNNELAYQYAERALTDETVVNHPGLAYKMYLLRASSFINLEPHNIEKQRRLVREAAEAYGDHPEIASLEASFLYAEKEYGKALEKYRDALESNELRGNSYIQNDFPNTIAGVYCDMGNLLSLANRDAEALEYYVKALQTERYHAAAFKGLLELCKLLPEDETIVFINSLYGLTNLGGDADWLAREAEMRFLVSHIAVCGRKKLVLYYANKWLNLYKKEDDILIYALVGQGNYSGALQIAAVYLQRNSRKFEYLTAAVIIMGGLFDAADVLKEHLSLGLYNLLNCCRERMPYTGDSAHYTAVLALLIRHASQDTVSSYLELTLPESGAGVNRFGTGIGAVRIISTLDVAEIYLAERLFREAVGFYIDFFTARELDEKKGYAAFKAGICYFRLKEYDESSKWLDKAGESGYNEPDLKEYRDWIFETGQKNDTWRNK